MRKETPSSIEADPPLHPAQAAELANAREAFELNKTDELWKEFGYCAGKQKEFMKNSIAATAMCDVCLVKVECLEFAIENNQNFYIWGGKTPSERKRLIKRRNQAPKK
ncbi:WhiB family transcriptional regulator [Candidatus Saccharibacteria bacterium]|nr:WhiB family transcriptional regulator [Candidatus Saccharibacteria bacterium]